MNPRQCLFFKSRVPRCNVSHRLHAKGTCKSQRIPVWLHKVGSRSFGQCETIGSKVSVSSDVRRDKLDNDSPNSAASQCQKQDPNTRIVAKPLNNTLPLLMWDGTIESQSGYRCMLEAGVNDIESHPPRGEHNT